MFVFAASPPPHAPVALGDDLTVERIADGVYLHVSKRVLDGQAVTANGLLAIGEQRALLISTAWTPEQTGRLAAWAREELGAPVGAVIVPHDHDDRQGGLPALAADVEVWASPVTIALMRDRGAMVAARPLPDGPTTITGISVVALAPGDAHAPGNVVVYLPRQDVLYGDCMVRAAGAGLGNLAAADVPRWRSAIGRVIARFQSPAIVVPGHGLRGDARLLDHTRMLLDTALAKEPRRAFFAVPRKGANFMNRVETRARFAAAAAAGIDFVRLAPDKWAGEGRDFLIGDADRTDGAVSTLDLARLLAVLDDADAARMPVVLTLLSLPGARWRQHNGDTSDFRLYAEDRYVLAAQRVWQTIALALRAHPAVVAYDLLNEPHPDRSPAPLRYDLVAVSRALVAAIREVDPITPILVESGDMAAPTAFDHLRPLADDGVLYSFHFYKPWAYVDHRQNGRHAYPGSLPSRDGRGAERWDRERLAEAMAAVQRFQERNALPATRIVLGELGVPRTHPGAAVWLRDVLAVADGRGWSWAFYSFREDTWHAMDYELGTTRPPASYWAAREQGLEPALERHDNELWDTIREALAR